jgi:hypothetical protein
MPDPHPHDVRRRSAGGRDPVEVVVRDWLRVLARQRGHEALDRHPVGDDLLGITVELNRLPRDHRPDDRLRGGFDGTHPAVVTAGTDLADGGGEERSLPPLASAAAAPALGVAMPLESGHVVREPLRPDVLPGQPAGGPAEATGLRHQSRVEQPYSSGLWYPQPAGQQVPAAPHRGNELPCQRALTATDAATGYGSEYVASTVNTPADWRSSVTCNPPCHRSNPNLQVAGPVVSAGTRHGKVRWGGSRKS